MTFRAKPVVKRRSRSSREHSGRRTLYMNIGFGIVVVAAVLILAAAAGAAWYGDHLASVASVNGVSIDKDQYRARYTIEDWRIAESESRLRDEAQAGHITTGQRDSTIQALEQQRTQLATNVLERLIDTELQRQLAAANGVVVTDADIDAELKIEATRGEQRHVWAIEVQPAITTGAAGPSDSQIAAARSLANQALKDLQGGKDFEAVAKVVSTGTTAAQGGDIGWYTERNGLDPEFSKAVFAAKQNDPTPVVLGADKVFRIGRVTDISPQSVDPNYTQKLTDAGIALADYRLVVASDVRHQRLQAKIIASVVDTATVQRRVSEIHIAEPQGKGDEVKVRHILFSPNHITDQTQLQNLPSTDPAWAKAKSDAQAAYDKLKPFVGTDQLETEFQALASQLSDDTGSKSSGGELPYFTQDAVDPGFGDAIFKTGLKKGDLIGPVQSSFGFHVILFEDRRPDPTSRINDAKLEAETAGADFAAIAKKYSDGPEASKGGDLGWVAHLQLKQQLEDAIFKTPVGKTSDVIEVSGDGFYLFHVFDEQTRKPDGAQADTLRASAFDDWYAIEKAKAKIDRQTSAVPSPAAS